jgi:hypothetical protein
LTVRSRLVVGVVLGLAVAAAASPEGARAGVEGDFVRATPTPPVPEPLASALKGIAANALAAHVGFLASPALEGRGLGSAGLEAAAEYAAASLALAGIPPLGSGYFQPVSVREVSAFGGELVVEARGGHDARTRAFACGADCRISPTAPGELSVPVVFAGHGIREAGIRDDFARLDVRGKAVLVLRGVPDGDAWRDPALTSRYDDEDADDRWEAKRAAAAALGAAAVLAVEGDDFAAELSKSPPAATVFLPSGPPDPVPLVRLSPAAARAILEPAGLDPASARTATSREVAGVAVTLRAIGTERLVATRNVVGVLVGSDPALREEAVVLGAHLDHLGAPGGVVHPGADDNASGVAALLEIARAFAALPARPKRTLVFAFWTGEEEGKLGSGHWVREPLWPLARTAAYLNLDMIGHPWRSDELRKLVAEKALPDAEAFLAALDPRAFNDPGLPPDAPHVEDALRFAGPATGMTLYLDRTDGTRGDSDYRDFARAGVGFVRFFGNFFPGYHAPGDTPANLDPAQVERMARFAFATAWRLADR